MPPLNHPVGAPVRCHIRTGGHDVTAYDWDQYLMFADQLPADHKCVFPKGLTSGYAMTYIVHINDLIIQIDHLNG